MKHTYSVLVILLMSIFLFSGIASAGVFTVDVFNKSISSDDIITVPVTVSAAENLGGYKIYVYNDDSNSQITINPSQPVSGNWDVNSDISREYQIVSFTVTDTVGLTGDYTLFSIDVLPLNSQVTAIPVNISVLEVYDVNAVDVTNDYTWNNGVITTGSTHPTSCVISFDANGGAGSIGSATVSAGESYTLPVCTFTAPEGQVFKAWLIGSTEYAAGTSYTPTASVTVKAVWTTEDTTAPGSFTINPLENGLVSWTVSEGATGYKFSLRDRTISETEDTGKKVNNEDVGTATNYDISSYLVEGHSYRVAVCAYDDAVKETWVELEFVFGNCQHTNLVDVDITYNGITKDFPQDEGDGTHYWYVNVVCDDCKEVQQENVKRNAEHNANTLEKNGVCECNYHRYGTGLSYTMYAVEDANTYLAPEANDGYHGGSISKDEEVIVLAEGLGTDGLWSLVKYSVTGTSREKVRFVESESLGTNDGEVVVTIFYPTEDTVCLTNEKLEIHWIASKNNVAEYAVKLYSENDELLCSPAIIHGNDDNTYNYKYTVPADVLSKLSGTKKYKVVVTALSDMGDVLGDDSVSFKIEDTDAISISFTSCLDGTKSSSYDVYYSEGYFAGDSRIYNHKLAQVSLGLAAASYTAPGLEYTAEIPRGESIDKQRYANIADAYQKLGFTNVEYYNYNVPLSDTSDKVAYSIAKKETRIGGKDTVIFVIVPRSGAYGGEWASNFNIGTGPYSEGFYEPAIMILETFKKELATVSDSAEVKVWTTGFSRGAAVSNLFAGELTRNAESLGLKQENIYAYTFATPQGVDTTYDINRDVHTDYTNIINIVNPSDIVPTVPMTSWGFDRYGVTYYFDYEAAKSSYTTISDLYKEMNKDIDKKKYEKYTPKNLVPITTRLSTIVSSNFDSKYLYDEIHSHYLRDILSLVFYEKDMDFGKLCQMPSSLTHLYAKDEILQAYDKVSSYKVTDNVGFEVYYGLLASLHLGVPILGEYIGYFDNIVTGVMTVGVINDLTVESTVEELFNILDVFIDGFVAIYFNYDRLDTITCDLSTLGMQHYHEVYMVWMSNATSNSDFFTDSNDEYMQLLSSSIDIVVVVDGEGTVSGTQKTLPNTNVLIGAHPDYGHEFTGWYDESGSLISTEEQCMIFVNTEHTFTAKFQHGYTIEYDLNGGTNDPKNPSRYYVTDADITLNAPSKSFDGKVHYIFDGWTWDGQTKPTQDVVIKSGSTGKKSYKAHWISRAASVNGQVTVPESNDLTIDVPNLGEEYHVEVSEIPTLSPLVGTTGNKPVGLISKYDITTTISPSQVGVATITFSLDKTDLPAGVKPTDIALYHKEAGKWVKLPTTYIRADSDKYWYSAQTTGFSPFAIGYELKDVFAILSPEANQEITTTSPLEVLWSESADAAGYTFTLRDNTLDGDSSSKTLINAVDVGNSLNYVIPSKYLTNGHEYQIIVSAYNSTATVSTESVFSIAIVSQIQEIKNTTETFNAKTAAELSYTLAPENIGTITAPVLAKGGLQLMIDNVVVEKIAGGSSTKVSAEVLANGAVSVSGDISDAESLKVSFIGRVLGDGTGDNIVDLSDAISALRITAEIDNPTNTELFYMDVSADSTIDLDDSILLLRYAAEIVDENYVTKA